MNASKQRQMNPRRPLWASLGGLLLAIAGLAGCVDTNKTLAEAGERRKLQEQVVALKRDVASRDATIQEQAARIQELQKIEPQQAGLIPHADRIEIDPLSGTYDDDHSGRPQGVVVYFRPYDADGDVVKAAGSATVQALDLANPPESQVVAERQLDAAALRKAWYGKFLTSHYTIRCPWTSGPPAHADLTVRVRFVDLLTGKPFEAVRQIKLAPASAVSAAP